MPLNGENSRKGSLDSWVANAKKEICKCCRKDLGIIVGNIAMFRGKCQTCRQKICSSCVSNNFCHKCRVKRLVKLTPGELMQLPGKQLLEIARMLHFHNPQGYEKSELVQLILAIYGLKWTRPIPQAPGDTSTPNVCEKPLGKCQNCDRDVLLCELSDTFCRKCDVLVRNNYQPEVLMQLSGKDLQDILELLHVPKSEAFVREKGELVMLLLKTIGIYEDWTPPVPQQPAARTRSVEPQSDTVIPSSANVPDYENSSSEFGNPTENSVIGSSQSHSSLDELQFPPSPSLVPESASPHLDNHASSYPNLADWQQRSGVEPTSSTNAWSNIACLEDIPSADVIQDLRASQLKTILQQSGVDIEGCCEKKDLADQVTVLWTNWTSAINQRPAHTFDGVGNPSSTAAPASSGQDAQSKSETERKPANSFIILPGEVPCLREITATKDLEHLSNRQLMAVLQKHSVDYSLCKERTELVERVTQLWNDVKKFNSSEEIPDEDICKICMDAAIDCVLLECGHMVACTECGRQMSECPVCRQYVVRVVHTFKT